MIFSPYTSQPPAGAAPSALAHDLRAGTLLLPAADGDGWCDSIGGLVVTGGTGTRTSRTSLDGIQRASVSGSAWADYFQDKGANDPREGYAWVMRATLVSSLANWGGLISRTTDNGTTSGWSWQRTNDDVVAVYHGVAGNWPLGITFSTLLDGQPHTLVGVWRKDQSRLELWRDGILLAAVNGVSTAPRYSAGQGQIKIMSSRDVAALNGSVAMVAVLGRALSTFEASALSANPWLLFAPQLADAQHFGIQSAGIAPVAGAVSLVGHAPAVDQPLIVNTLAPVGGAIACLGAAPSIDQRWPPFAEDDFSGSGNLPNPPWTKTALNGLGDLVEDSGKLRAAAAGSSALYAHQSTPPSADYTVSLEIQCGSTANLNGSAVGVAGRYVGTHYYVARYVGSAGEYALEKFDLFGGGLSTLDTYSAGLAASATVTLSLRMVGDQIAVLVDGVAVIEVTDSTISSAGQAGVLAYTTATTAWYGDSFEARPVSQPAAAIEPVSGASLFAGHSPGISQSHTVYPAVGIVAWAGGSPAISRAASVRPHAGAVACAGHAPSVRQPVAVQPQAGTAVWQGGAPSVVAGRTVAPAAGAVQWAGSAPTVSQPSIVRPGTGSALWAGAVPAVVSGRAVSPAAGAAHWAGHEPGVRQAHAVQPASGSAQHAGQSPAIAQPRTVSPQPGAAVWMGHAPVVGLANIVDPADGGIVWQGYSPALSQPRAVAPSAGATAWYGHVPGVLTGRAVAPSAGSAQWAGNAPGIAQPRGIVPQAGAVAWVGNSPYVGVINLVQPDSGAILWAGALPGILQARTISPGIGGAVWAGGIPAVNGRGEIAPDEVRAVPRERFIAAIARERRILRS